MAAEHQELLKNAWKSGKKGSYKYKAALQENGFINLMGDNALIQPGHMQEILLHETAVAWIRWRLTKCTPTACWEETPAQYTCRIKKVVEDINAHLDVAGLCNGLPKRLQALIDAEGGRLKH